MMSSNIPYGMISPEKSEEIIKLQRKCQIFSCITLVFFPLFYAAFPIMALLFICEPHHLKVQKLRSGQFFCCSQKAYFTLMYIVLVITFAFLVLLVVINPVLILVGLVLFTIYLMQAITYQKYVTLFTLYYVQEVDQMIDEGRMAP